MEKQTLLRIAFEYELSKMSEREIENLIAEELSKDEKFEALSNMSDDKIRLVLFKKGYKQEFLKTI